MRRKQLSNAEYKDAVLAELRSINDNVLSLVSAQWYAANQLVEIRVWLEAQPQDPTTRRAVMPNIYGRNRQEVKK